MYKSFRVKNFRCFKDLQINDLGRVNLIAGQNNTGKTALLEAMYIFTRPKSPGVLLDLQEIRGLVEPEASRRDYWRQYFSDMDSAEPIVFETNEKGSEAYIALILSELSDLEVSNGLFEGYRRFLEEELRLTVSESHKQLEQIDAILEFSMSEKGHKFSPAYLPSNSDLPTRSFRQVESNSEFIPVQGREQRITTLKRLSQLDKHGDTTLLIHVLAGLDPRLSDVRLSMPDGVMDIWARVNGALLPLKAMGEGVNRICHILVTMLSGVDYLFVDEIENGIHHSVQSKVWKAIGQVARELDIQVFATTHSYEMIEAAHEAFKDDDPYEFRFHRLNRRSDDDYKDEIEAITYNKAGVEAFIRSHYEVRGWGAIRSTRASTVSCSSRDSMIGPSLISWRNI
ncbi:MAG: AAA family ATPase [Chloroflexi bacterium]|nr:AAA family ATPase [Chloroflexota bacterium]